jgi:hypothetical protein
VSALHLLSILVGCIVGHWGWQEGMAGYFCTSWLFAILIALRFKKAKRPQGSRSTPEGFPHE